MFDAVKLIEIQATSRYPVVSAYEFEYLKGEEAVKDRLKNCSVYFILQRPLTYFNDVTLADGEVLFSIVDNVNPPLSCRLNLNDCKMWGEGNGVEIELQYYKKLPDPPGPQNDVAAFKILDVNGSFIVWETPQKLLYESIVKGLPCEIIGDITPYLHHHVHYIGKAWSQKTWERLTGHKKVQKILTLQDSLSEVSRKPSYEISIFMLEIVGFDEANMMGGYLALLPNDVEPIIHNLRDDEEITRFFSNALLQTNSEELTSEAEALLVSVFKPEYNKIKYDIYPNIANGTRSAGYTLASLNVTGMPLLLKTDYRPSTEMDSVKF